MARQPAQHAADEGAHLLELAAAEAARGRRRRAEADAGSDRRLFRIEGNAVLVAGDARAVEALLGDVAGQPLRPQVDQHEVVVGAAGDDVERSEEHTSELQSLMRISYAVFCLKKKEQERTR